MMNGISAEAKIILKNTLEHRRIREILVKACFVDENGDVIDTEEKLFCAKKKTPKLGKILLNGSVFGLDYIKNEFSSQKTLAPRSELEGIITVSDDPRIKSARVEVISFEDEKTAFNQFKDNAGKIAEKIKDGFLAACENIGDFFSYNSEDKLANTLVVAILGAGLIFCLLQIKSIDNEREAIEISQEQKDKFEEQFTQGVCQNIKNAITKEGADIERIKLALKDIAKITESIDERGEIQYNVELLKAFYMTKGIASQLKSNNVSLAEARELLSPYYNVEQADDGDFIFSINKYMIVLPGRVDSN